MRNYRFFPKKHKENDPQIPNEFASNGIESVPELAQDIPSSDVGRENSEPTEQPELFEPLGNVLRSFGNRPKVPLLLQGVREGSFGFVFGPAKSGKTIYLESLLQHLSCGRAKFMDNPLNGDCKKCLFISLEEGAKEDRYYRNKIQLEHFTNNEIEKINSNYLVSSDGMPFFIYNEEGWQKTERSIVKSQSTVVVIDSLNRLTRASNSEEETAKTITEKLKNLVGKLKITLFVINHTPKDKANQALALESMSGSRIYASEADFIIGINRISDNSRYMKLIASRYEKDDYDTVDQFKINDVSIVELTEKVIESTFFSETDGRFDDSNANIIMDEIVKILAGKVEKEISPKELKHLYLGENKQMSWPTLFAGLNKLTDSQIHPTSRRLTSLTMFTKDPGTPGRPCSIRLIPTKNSKE